MTFSLNGDTIKDHGFTTYADTTRGFWNSYAYNMNLGTTLINKGGELYLGDSTTGADRHFYVEVHKILDTKDLTLVVGDTWNHYDNLTYHQNIKAHGASSTTEIPTDQIRVENNVDTSKPGVYSVKYLYDIAEGRTVTKTAKVTVIPKKETINAIPKITAGDQTLTEGDAFDPLKDVTANDAEEGDLTKSVEVIENNVPVDEKGNVTKEGSYTVTYKVTDSKGASSKKTVTIKVNRKSETINAIPKITAGDQTLTVGDVFDPLKDVTANDAEEGDLTKSVEVIENNVPVDEKGNVTKEGSYTVTYKVTDSKGASSKKKVTIKVNRKSETINAIPKIKAGDQTLTVGDVLDLKKDVTASDVEDGDLTKAVEVLDHDIPVDKDGKVTTAGTYTVTYKVTDSKKASSTKKVTITVNPKAETINAIPKITAGDQTLTVGDPLNVMKDVTATDTEDGDLTAFVKVPENNVPIDANANTTTPGSYTITYTVTDSKGATSTKTVTVTVNPKMETINQIPVIKADDQTLAVGDAFDPLKDVTAVDTEDGDLTTSVEVIENNVPVDEKGNVTKEGSYTVTYKVTDSQDASSTKTITVTVNPVMVELNHIPTISASDQVLTVGDPLEVMKDVSATDDEDGDLTAYVKVPENTVPTDADANTTTPGSYTITYTVTDTQGASSTKTVTVIVNPKMEVINQIPQIQAEDQELYVGDSFNPLKGVTAGDTEDGDITGSIEILENNVPVNEEGQVTAAGTYSVTYTVKDSQGASAVKTIQVTVKEKTKEQPEKEEDDHPTENGSSSKTTTKENTGSSKQNRDTKTSTGTYALVYGLISAGALLGIIAMVLRYKRSR